jgi:hypothetical protein
LYKVFLIFIIILIHFQVNTFNPPQVQAQIPPGPNQGPPPTYQQGTAPQPWYNGNPVQVQQQQQQPPPQQQQQQQQFFQQGPTPGPGNF